MERRQVLQRLVPVSFPLVSGCTTLATSSDESSSVEVRDETDAAPHDFRFDVRPISQPDEAGPASLRISVENRSSRPQTLLLPEGLPFAEVFPQQNDPHVVLVPEDPHHLMVEEGDSLTSMAEMEDAPPEERVDGCWRLRHSIVELYGGQRVEFQDGGEIGPTVELEGGESRSERYYVYTSSTASECLPAGRYRFESSNYFGADESCGFTLRIE